MTGMNEVAGNYFLFNGKTKSIEDIDKICKDVKFEVYEVIRIMNGIPLFCEDHYERMMSSLQLLHKQINIDFVDFVNQIKLLADYNKSSIGNVKISVGEQVKNLIMHFIPHHYPTNLEYQQGVKAGLYHAERINPNVKAHLVDLRKNVNEYLKNTGFYEVFYVDRNGSITEGSRSNVFFIRDEKVYTCPPEKVLLGITRQKVMECLNDNQIPVFEDEINESEINSFDSVFMTGTSPKILPIASIDNLTFSCTNETMGKIMFEYDRKIDLYIKSALATRQ